MVPNRAGDNRSGQRGETTQVQMERIGVKISDIQKIENSLITLLVQDRKDANKYGIVYINPSDKKPVQLFSSEFASRFKALVTNFHEGFATGAIVGIARERTPADAWHSDTIERSIIDKNSIYRGILRIINEDDGLPVFIKSTSTVGNIMPALEYLHKGNPLEVKKALDHYSFIQKSIVSRITAGKPQIPQESLFIGDQVGDGVKSEMRAKAFNKALESLQYSPGR
jgi:hypothetical protein